MSNSLTALAPTLFSIFRMVPRELTGFLGAVARDFDSKNVAQGDAVTVPVVPTIAVTSIPSPAQTFTMGTDRVMGSKLFTLGQGAQASWNLTAEQERRLLNGGTATDVEVQTIQQAVRSVINQIEGYIAGVVQANASRAYGTAGTAPFGSSLADLAQPRQICVDNGFPVDLRAVISTTAGSNLRILPNLTKVNEAGDDQLLRAGVLGDIFGMPVRESAQVKSVTKGTGTGYLVNNGAGYAVGATAITVDTGSGTILAGDIITLAGDTNKYVVATALAANVVTIQEPGLRQAHADNDAITVGNSYTANAVFHRNAVVAVVRPLLQPTGGGIDQMTLTDDQTGLSMLMLRVVGDQVSSYYLRAVFDGFAPNPAGIGTLLG